jgi:hypothetical protein
MPEEILADLYLTEQEKADRLCRLAYDAAEQAVASDEGMPGDDDDLQHRVLWALHQLDRGMDVEHTSPTKQHGACLIRLDRDGDEQPSGVTPQTIDGRRPGHGR